MSELDNLNEGGTGKRPTFLTVLCILTFIGSGWGVISGLIGLAAAPVVTASVEHMDELEEEMAEAMEEINSEMGEDSALSSLFGGLMETSIKSAEHYMTLTVVALLASLMCLFGAIMMWNLKKTGYYIYVLGAIGAPLVTAILIGFGWALGGLFFGALFVVLYGLNLKHMA